MKRKRLSLRMAGSEQVGPSSEMVEEGLVRAGVL